MIHHSLPSCTTTHEHSKLLALCIMPTVAEKVSERMMSAGATSSTVRVFGDRLESYCTELLRRGGSDDAEARTVAANLTLSNLKGNDSHGVGYLPRYLKSAQKGLLKANYKCECKVSGPFVHVDGNLGYGQVNGERAMEAGVRAARASGGLAVVSLKNSHHLGRIGKYAELVAEQGIALMVKLY